MLRRRGDLEVKSLAYDILRRMLSIEKSLHFKLSLFESKLAVICAPKLNKKNYEKWTKTKILTMKIRAVTGIIFTCKNETENTKILKRKNNFDVLSSNRAIYSAFYSVVAWGRVNFFGHPLKSAPEDTTHKASIPLLAVMSMCKVLNTDRDIRFFLYFLFPPLGIFQIDKLS